MNMKFTEPPQKYRRERKYDWDKVAAELRDNPGKWALLDADAKSSVSVAIKQGKISNFHPSQGFEVTTANTRMGPPRLCETFVRYNPMSDNSLTKKEAKRILREAEEKEN